MKEMTVAYLVLISVLLASIGGVSYVLLPQSFSFDGGAAGMVSIEKPEGLILPIPKEPIEEPEQTSMKEPVEPESRCVAGLADNCPYDYNPDQADADGDGIGDACDDEYNPMPPCSEPEIVQATPPLTGAVSRETNDSPLLVALAALIMLLVLIMGITSIFRSQIKNAYHKATARVKFHLKR